MIIGGFIVLVLTAALVAPYFIDWTNYRAEFEREASRILGREVTVTGDAEARLLPFPSVTFSDVQVAGARPGEPSMTVERFSMDAELAPFMRGEILIFDMRLERPRLHIDVAADGAVDWAMRPTMPLGAQQVALETVAVSEGVIELSHAVSGRLHRVSGIDAEISARTLAGPWRIEGRGDLDGLAIAFSVSTGTVDESGNMRLRLRASPDAYPLALETDGLASLAGGVLSYEGAFRLDAGGTQQTAAEQGPTAPPQPARYRFTGDFAFAHDGLEVPEFRMETGSVESPYTASGSASLDLGADTRFAIRADGAQFRFDEAAGAADGPGLSLEARLAAVKTFLANLPRPTIPGEIDVELPAMVVGDTTIRDISMRAQPSDRGWALNRFSALLPGRTTFEARGALATAGSFGFDGSMLVAVGQPSGFAAWVARDVDEAIRKLPAAGFEANVRLSEDVQLFDEVELILGEARFHGAMERRQAKDARPSLRLALDGGALDVDGLGAFASLFIDDRGEQRLAGHDLDLEVKAGPVFGAGIRAGSADVALRLREDAVEIDRLSIGDLAGASISATGAIRDFPERPVGSLDASVVAVDLAPLVDFLAARFPDLPLLAAAAGNAAVYPGLYEDARLDIVASAAEEDGGSTGLAVSAKGEAGGTRFSLAATAKASDAAYAAWPVTVSFEAENPEAAALYALYGLPGVPLGFAGNLRTGLDLSGSLDEGLATRFQASGEGTTAGFEGTARTGTSGSTLRGAASVDSADIEPWLMTAGVSFPGMGLGTPFKFDGDVALAEGRLTLAGAEGTVLGDAYSAELDAGLRDGRPHLSGKIAMQRLDASALAALAIGEAALRTDGPGWPDQPFPAQTFAPFTGELAIETAALTAGSTDVTDASFKLTVVPAGVAVSDFSGVYRGGRLSGIAELKNNAGTGLLSMQGRLAGADLAAFPELQGLSGTADVSASLTASGKTVEGMVASLAGSGTVTAGDLAIAGLNPAALPAVLTRADAIGRDIDQAAVAGFVPAIAGDGSFAAGSADLAFTVAAGQMRAPPLHLDSGSTGLGIDLRADLVGWRTAVSGEMTYDAGHEAVVGSEPVVRFSFEGPIGDANLVIDSAPMAQFLTQRALEKEQARVEAMQAALLEKQRLRREVRYYDAREAERQRIAEEKRLAEEEARRIAQEQARLRAEEEARKAAEAQKQREEAEAERRRQAEEAEARQRQQSAPADPEAIERAPLPPPDRGAKPQDDAQAPAATAPRGMFEVFREDGTSIDAILKSLEENQ